MSDREYIYTSPPIINAIGGDPNTGTKWNKGWVDGNAAQLNAVFAQIAGDINFLLAKLGTVSLDTLAYTWASNDTVIVSPGIAVASDGTVHTVVNPTTLNLNNDLDTGTRAANSIYFIWIGKDTVTDETKLKLSLNYDTPPTCLVSASAYRLRNFFNTNTGNSNIEQFCAPLPDDWPVGEVFLWTTPYKPAGSHWAQGQIVSRTHGAYAAIFAKMGTTWGVGDGSTTFGLPDTRGRSAMGKGQGSGLTNRTLGTNNLGEEAHVLSVAELAAHRHTSNAGSGGAQQGSSGGNLVYYASGTETGLTGSNTAHNVIHPVLVVGFIIKG